MARIVQSFKVNKKIKIKIAITTPRQVLIKNGATVTASIVPENPALQAQPVGTSAPLLSAGQYTAAK